MVRLTQYHFLPRRKEAKGKKQILLPVLDIFDFIFYNTTSSLPLLVSALGILCFFKRGGESTFQPLLLLLLSNTS